MLASIEEARHYVLLEMYLFESGETAERFIEALSAAAGRGVTVCLLLDDFGSFSLKRKDRQRLQAAGVRIALYNPLGVARWLLNLPRNHRKLLVVDGVVAYTGGAGITDQFNPQVHPESFWHETMIEVRGLCVRDWESLFGDTWMRWAGEPLRLPESPPASASGKRKGRVVVHPRARVRSDIMRSLVKRIRLAENRVWISTAYFIPSWKLRRSLMRAARSGVDVRLLLPGPLTDHPAVRLLGRRYYEKLLRDGVRIFEYQPRFIHAKVMICDGWASIGSSNLDHWNHRWNLEANQELTDPEVLALLETLFEENFQSSHEVHYHEWLRRPLHQRLTERLLGRVLALVGRVGEPRPPRPRRED